MDNFDSKPATDADSAGLQEQLNSLRHLIVSALILMIIVSGTLNIYLLRVVKYARTDVTAFRSQAGEMLAEYERVQQPAMQDFVNRLVQFGQSSQSDEAFAALMKRYGLTKLMNATNAPAPLPVTAPKTGAVPAAK